jgi:hypothetical protein
LEFSRFSSLLEEKEGGINMMDKQKETPDVYLERFMNILKDMASIPDVNDFWIADSADNIVYSNNGMHALHPDVMPKIKEKVGITGGNQESASGCFMVRERLLQYNGYTILYGCAGNGWQVLFFLKKDAYLSIAMLEMETCLRRTDKLRSNLSS